MNVEDLRKYCLSFPRAEEAMPLGDTALVFKVSGKWFCLVFLQGDLRINIKCAADEIYDMRGRFPAVTAGFRMNKKYWNTVLLDGSISDSMLKNWIRKSYRLVVSGLTQEENGLTP